MTSEFSWFSQIKTKEQSKQILHRFVEKYQSGEGYKNSKVNLKQKESSRCRLSAMCEKEALKEAIKRSVIPMKKLQGSVADKIRDGRCCA